MINNQTTVISPANLLALIGYYSCPDLLKSEFVTGSECSVLVDLELITMEASGKPFSISPKGEYYMHMILNTPLPVATFVDPREVKG